MTRLLRVVALIVAVAMIIVGITVLTTPFTYTWTAYGSGEPSDLSATIAPYVNVRQALGLIAVGVGAAGAGVVLGFWLGRRGRVMFARGATKPQRQADP